MTKRDDLIEATRDLLWERGYTATSPAAILDASGAGQGSMYHHFRGKEGLARAAIQRNAVEMREQITADLGSDGLTIDKVGAYLRRDRDALKGCQFGRLVQDPDVVESSMLRTEVAEMFSWTRAQLTEVIAEGIGRGELREDLDPARTAATIAATVQGAYVLARAAQDVAVFDDAVDGVLALLEGARP